MSEALDWDSHSFLKPIIKAAIKSGIPPMAMLTDNPTRTEHCKWDLKLIKAYYINQAFEIDGHPIHVEESRSIAWTAKRKKLRSAEAVDKEQELMQRSKSKHHGIRVVAVPTLRDGHKWPTRRSWLEEKAQNQAESDSGSEKLKNVTEAQEERARQKMIELGLELP